MVEESFDDKDVDVEKEVYKISSANEDNMTTIKIWFLQSTVTRSDLAINCILYGNKEFNNWNI